MSAKVDIFFRSAYGQPRSNEPRSAIDTILGNISESLRVDDGLEEIDIEDFEEMVESARASA